MTTRSPESVPVEELLPHRPPFLLIDRVIEVTRGVEGIAERKIRENDPVFEGHFPGNPLYPGTLLVEVMAQATATIFGLPEAGAEPAGPPKERYLVGIDKLRLKGMTRPGDVVRVHVKLIKHFNRFTRVSAKALIEGKVVAAGELTFSS